MEYWLRAWNERCEAEELKLGGSDKERRSLHEVSTPDVLSGGPPWSGPPGQQFRTARAWPNEVKMWIDNKASIPLALDLQAFNKTKHIVHGTKLRRRLRLAAASTGLKRVIGPSRPSSELKLRISPPYGGAPLSARQRRS